MIEGCSHLLAARGKKIVEFNIKKDAPALDDMLAVTLGPTGNLRAPTLRIGKKLVVGFNEEMYESVLS